MATFRGHYRAAPRSAICADMAASRRIDALLLLACAALGCSSEGGRGSADGSATNQTSVSSASAGTTLTTASATDTPATDASATLTATDASATDASASAEQGEVGTGGACVDDSECPPGQHCGAWSKECLDPDGCVLTEDCDPGFVCTPAGTCEIGGDCGAESFSLTAVPPNVMIVLDRSGSMDGDVKDSDKPRWDVAKDAIELLVNAFNDAIRFGLVTYSACIDGQECSAGKIVVPLGNLNAGPINGFLGGKDLDYLCNSGKPETSTGNTLYALIGEDSLQDPARGNAVLLITDGGENDECQKNTDGPQAAAKLLAQDPVVKTFVVGFSDEVIDSLADIAAAGGTQTPYNANNPDTLEAALTAIAGAVATCDFLLDSVPDDPGKVFVFFDDDPAGVPNDPVDGWTYDPNTNTISFHGAACEAIKSGAVIDVDVVCGCNVPVPG